MARISPRRAAYNKRVMERRNRDRLGIQRVREEAAVAAAAKEADKAPKKKPAAKTKTTASKKK